MKEALSVIHERKSVRNFTGEEVNRGDLEKIVKAGMAAPSAVNMQPWSFVVVTERKILDELAAGLPYAQMLKRAGAAIIVCAEKLTILIGARVPGKNYPLLVDALIVEGAR